MPSLYTYVSGHSSHSACWATLLTLCLLRRAAAAILERAPVRRRALYLLVFVPAPIALFVAASRVHDNWHHPADVVCGVMLGALCASLVERAMWVAHGVEAAAAAREQQWERKPLV